MMLPKTRFAWTLILIGTALLGTAWIIMSQEPVAQQVDASGLTEAPIAGYLAPDFTLNTIGGQAVTLSDLRGQPIVINFWATWCPPCRAEIPYFQAAATKYNGQVIILGVNQAESLVTVNPFVREFGMTYPVPLDENSTVSRLYSVSALPTTLFVDSDGIIQEVFPGIMSQAVLEDRIEQLLQN